MNLHIDRRVDDVRRREAIEVTLRSGVGLPH